jgi:Fic family protein
MEPRIGAWRAMSGETPIDPSHLKDRSITTRLELCRAEALNMGVKWPSISEQVLALTQDLPTWDEYGMPCVEQATRLHHRAVWIHPFMNGNGRWARLLANIWLRLHKTPVVFWPEEHIRQESPIRNDYLKALQYADEGDFRPLLA